MAMCFHQVIKIIFYDFNTMEFINDKDLLNQTLRKKD
jgi:hypothetical protein